MADEQEQQNEPGTDQTREPAPTPPATSEPDMGDGPPPADDGDKAE